MIDFDRALLLRLRRASPHPKIRDLLQYATLPPGKLFRPRLLEALALDLQVSDVRAVEALGCALEFHHAYSLVHDDLPCMDNDLERRGKPATHVAFGEWQALLGGDSLLALSYATLEEIRHPHAGDLRRLFHWATGARGLIMGQWIDLAHEGESQAGLLVRMHELKTARLMQVATVGAYLLSPQEKTSAGLKRMLRYGASVGVGFQLLDDLDDLCASALSAHERAVNPFLQAPAQMRQRLGNELRTMSDKSYPSARRFLGEFVKKSSDQLLLKQNEWGAHVPSEREALCRLLASANG